MAGTKGKLAWHVHHQTLIERLYEPITRRREFIKDAKPPRERALRLKLLKVVKNQEEAEKLFGKPFTKTTEVKLKALHNKECPKCPFKFSRDSALQGNIFDNGL